MKYAIPSYRIFPLGDQALVIDFGNRVDESLNNAVISLFRLFQNTSLRGVVDFVPAYSSLTIFYDPEILTGYQGSRETAFHFFSKQVHDICHTYTGIEEKSSEVIKIGVCYDPGFAPDMPMVCERAGMDAASVIELHTSITYRVYMLGFLPGFAYLGETDARLDVPRKKIPSEVQQGSVGLAGRQTGVYPFRSPGGWQIIGRTPVTLFDAHASQPSLLKAGDLVRFYSITTDEFKNY